MLCVGVKETSRVIFMFILVHETTVVVVDKGDVKDNIYVYSSIGGIGCVCL